MAQHAPSSDLLAYFDTLPPVPPSDMTGLWQGHERPSGHPLDGVLANLGWYGKRFRPDGRADALLFRFRQDRLTAIDPAWIPMKLALRLGPVGRTRIARNLFSNLQRGMRAQGPTASVESREFRGIVTTAMVYDRQPITDYLRRIDERSLLGVMEMRDDPRHYFFTLTRPPS
jgi:hypothetical protein